MFLLIIVYDLNPFSSNFIFSLLNYDFQYFLFDKQYLYQKRTISLFDLSFFQSISKGLFEIFSSLCYLLYILASNINIIVQAFLNPMSQMYKDQKHEGFVKQEEKPKALEGGQKVLEPIAPGVTTNEEKQTIYSVKEIKIKSGPKSMVDSLVPNASQYQVLTECATGQYYHKILCQYNIAQNNSKFYITQVLVKNAKTNCKKESKEEMEGEEAAGAEGASKKEEGESGDENIYCVWNRWGRIGMPGQNCMMILSKEKAIEAHLKKIEDKCNSGYSLMEISQ